MPPSANQVNRLRGLDTSAVSDAMDVLGIASLVSGLSPVGPGERIAGRVVPVQLVPLGHAPPPRAHLGSDAIERSGPDDVIVVDNGGRLEMGAWGGLLSRGAVARDIAGVVVDGACRDADEIAEIGLPVYARATTARTARGRVIQRDDVDRIHICGVPVTAGDLVLADQTAVAFLPADRAEEVIDAAERIMQREATMANALAAGMPASAVLGADYEHLLERLAALSELPGS